MSTWNFSYDLMTAPTKFNIRPTVIIENLTVDSNSTIIHGFELPEILQLTVDMKIEIEKGGVIVSSTLKIDSIDISALTVTMTGDIEDGITNPNTYTFYTSPTSNNNFTDKNSPLSGQEIHDNFFYLAEGLMNHQDRLSLVEIRPQTVPSQLNGYVRYSGIVRNKGTLYGGEALELLATDIFNTASVYDPANITSFSIAMDNGIDFSSIIDSEFHEISVGATLGNNNTFTPTTFCNHVNVRLINNGSTYGFGIASANMASYSVSTFYDNLNWGLISSNAAFYVRIDDADIQDYIKISFTNEEKGSFTSRSSIISILNTKFYQANINNKIEADELTPYLVIKGKNTRNSVYPGCSRIEILNVGDGTFIEEVLKITGTTAYDFSTTIQFVPEGTKVKIIGLDPSFNLVLKDDEAVPLLSKAGYNIDEFDGNSTLVHTAFPNEANTSLNFNGNFNAYSFNSESASFNTLNVNTLALNNLTVTGSNTPDITISFEDLYVNNDLEVNDNTLLNTMTVTGATTFESTVDLEGVTTISGATTFNSNVFISNDAHTEDYTLYKAVLLAGSTFNALNSPVETDTSYLLYNGNFGAFDIDAVGTLAIHGEDNRIGRLYRGSTVPNNNTIILNYNGHFRATTVTGSSSRVTKTDIYDSEVNALDILMNTNIVDYKFKTDLDTQRIGFIAEDTNMLLSTPTKDGVDVTNSIGVIIKAIQELYTLVKK